jgi:hypothetical protein
MVRDSGKEGLTESMAGSRDDNAPAELIGFLARHDPEIRSLALGLRQVVLDAIAPCHEYMFQMRSKVMLLYGASARIMADGICQIAIFQHHVTLVFPDGIDLEDSSRALRGTGRTMRHVRVTARSDLARPELRSLLRQARVLVGVAEQPRRGRREVVTQIKPSDTPTSARVRGHRYLRIWIRHSSTSGSGFRAFKNARRHDLASAAFSGAAFCPRAPAAATRSNAAANSARLPSPCVTPRQEGYGHRRRFPRMRHRVLR